METTEGEKENGGCTNEMKKCPLAVEGTQIKGPLSLEIVLGVN
jgi:hypothetical protein